MKNVYKVTAFALPISIGMLMNIISNFFAMMMVAQLGKQELAAGALAASTNMTLTTIIGTLFYAVGILVGHARGQNKSSADIGAIVKSSCWLVILLITPFSFLIWNANIILLFFHQDPQLISRAQGYFHYAALSMVPLMTNGVISQFYTGMGHARFTMKISMITLLPLLLLSYGFTLGKFGLPQLALAGVTCAAWIIQSIVCISLLFYLCAGKTPKQYAIFTNGFWPDWTLCKRILILGIPIGIQFGTELAALAVATYMMGYFGVIALAASQIVFQYVLIFITIILGLTQAISVLISQAYGQRNFNLIKDYLNAALIILAGLSAATFALFFLAPQELINLYLNTGDASNTELNHLAIYFFMIAAVMLSVDGVRNLLSGTLRGMHDSKAPMRIGIACLWGISLPASYLFAFTCHGGPIGLRI